MSLEDDLDRAAADGRITHEDRLEVERFAAFLSDQDPSSRARYRRHYPESRRAQLALTLRGIVLARLVRDAIGLRIEREAGERDRLAENLAAWKRVLASIGGWERQVAHG